VGFRLPCLLKPPTSPEPRACGPASHRKGCALMQQDDTVPPLPGIGGLEPGALPPGRSPCECPTPSPVRAAHRPGVLAGSPGGPPGRHLPRTAGAGDGPFPSPCTGRLPRPRESCRGRGGDLWEVGGAPLPHLPCLAPPLHPLHGIPVCFPRRGPSATPRGAPGHLRRTPTPNRTPSRCPCGRCGEDPGTVCARERG
jgi:hypothetical protein